MENLTTSLETQIEEESRKAFLQDCEIPEELWDYITIELITKEEEN
jgi:hypothetical protein